jgi:hypothetical protein
MNENENVIAEAVDESSYSYSSLPLLEHVTERTKKVKQLFLSQYSSDHSPPFSPFMTPYSNN